MECACARASAIERESARVRVRVRVRGVLRYLACSLCLSLVVSVAHRDQTQPRMLHARQKAGNLCLALSRVLSLCLHGRLSVPDRCLVTEGERLCALISRLHQLQVSESGGCLRHAVFVGLCLFRALCRVLSLVRALFELLSDQRHAFAVVVVVVVLSVPLLPALVSVFVQAQDER